MTWREQAKLTIQFVNSRLPDNATLAERTKAIDDAYPFEERRAFPYKMWLEERRKCLKQYGYVSKQKPKPIRHESPMERAKRKTRELGRWRQ